MQTASTGTGTAQEGNYMLITCTVYVTKDRLRGAVTNTITKVNHESS